MGAKVTGLYAALLTPLFLVLSLRVIGRRRARGVTIGVADDPALERTARVHANFAEYVPFALLLMLFVELSGYRTWIVYAWGVSPPNEDYRLRVVGMALTFAVLTASALLLLTAA